MSFIQWYPGHMHLTRQLIEERIKAIDVVIEVLDARIPGSSFNPLLQDPHRPQTTRQAAQQARRGRPGANPGLAAVVQRPSGHPRHRHGCQ